MQGTKIVFWSGGQCPGGVENLQQSQYFHRKRLQQYNLNQSISESRLLIPYHLPNPVFHFSWVQQANCSFSLCKFARVCSVACSKVSEAYSTQSAHPGALQMRIKWRFLFLLVGNVSLILSEISISGSWRNIVKGSKIFCLLKSRLSLSEPHSLFFF